MSGKKLLVVDDSQTVRVIVERILTEAGYEVMVASDGYDALSRINEEVSLVVLDVNMPELDGYGFCQKLNEMGDQFQQLPIVFLTCVESRALELLGRQFGAYLHKPVNGEELLGAVAGLLSRTSASVS